MFELPAVDLPDLSTAGDDALVSAIEDWGRVEAAAAARRLAAIAELVERRSGDEEDPQAYWACDDWDFTASEVAAALGITHRRASGQMHIGSNLRNRLPRVAALLAEGRISFRVASAISWRTHLIIGDDVLAAVDADLAVNARRFGPMSDSKLERDIDNCVTKYDPDALRRTQEATRSRDVQIRVKDDDSGTASVWARLFASDATLLKRRLAAMIESVCGDDQRSTAQRRADALGALGAGAERLALACTCGNTDCPGHGTDARADNVVIHVLTEPAAVDAARDPSIHGATDTTTTSGTPVGTPSTAAILGGGVLPTPLLAELIHLGATVKPLSLPGSAPEPRYRPSAALAAFVRMRDMTCRFPGCDVPAEFCDLDHVIPWPLGPTHPSNLHCKCRKHHLLKTFWGGPDGWRDRQLPDGRVIWTAPSGRTYTTHPGSRIFFPTWNTTTADLPAGPPNPPATPCRGAMMPMRRRTRAQDRAHRIRAERALNTRAKPPP